MTYVWQRWMAEEYRAAGLNVVEIDGWENRGRPASTGAFDPRGPETTHHTGSHSSASDPRPSLSILITGRSDLPGPLCHKATAYDGTVILIAAGRANHAGRVGKNGVPGMPYGADGNALALGNEVMTDGLQPLSEAQKRSIAIQNAVDLRHFGKGPEYAHRHADISATGKWDIGQLTTDQLRTLVRDAMQEDDMPTPAEIREIVDDAIADATPDIAAATIEALMDFEIIPRKDVDVREVLRKAAKQVVEKKEAAK